MRNSDVTQNGTELPSAHERSARPGHVTHGYRLGRVKLLASGIRIEYAESLYTSNVALAPLT